MIRICHFIIGFMLCISILYAQESDSLRYKKYIRDKNTFETFERDHRRFVQTANHRIAYLKWGQPTEKVFIWLPGSFLSAYDFYPFAESLVKAGYCVLSIDHYGHGLTSIPGRDLDFWDFADDLAAILDDLHIKNAVIGGFSRGGYMATAFHDKYPDRVKALVLEDGGSVPFKSLFDRMNSAQKAAFFRSVEPPAEVKKLLFDVYRSDFEIYNNIAQLDGSAQQWQIFGFIKHQDGNSLLYKELNAYMHMEDSVQYAELLDRPAEVSRYASSITRVDPIKSYRSLRVPMLIIDAVGKTDTFDSGTENQLLKSMHPDLIQQQLFDCADHNVHFACPEDFLKALQAFLATL